jgi:hypothetical protein
MSKWRSRGSGEMSSMALVTGVISMTGYVACNNDAYASMIISGNQSVMAENDNQ